MNFREKTKKQRTKIFIFILKNYEINETSGPSPEGGQVTSLPLTWKGEDLLDNENLLDNAFTVDVDILEYFRSDSYQSQSIIFMCANH